MSAPRLNYADPAAVAEWLADLYERFGDVDALVTDMLRPPGERQLGPDLHASLWSDYRTAIIDSFEYAGVVLEGDHGDPSGNGGGGPVA